MEKILWNHCSSCNQKTKHTVLFVKSKFDRDEIMEYGITHFQIVECNGCETICFRSEIHDYYAIENDEEGVTIETFPPDLQNYEPLRGVYNLPTKIKDVYNQTLLAFKGKSFLLTGVGFRAVIEAICIEEKIKGNNLEQRINNLVKNKLITEKEADRLHSIRFLGNDAVHDMEIPKEDKLYLVLSIIDHLLKNLYLIDKAARDQLDTIIKDFKGFEELLKKILPKFEIGDEKTLKEILGKNIRQITTDLLLLEKALIEGISKGMIDYLSLGANKPTEQESSNQQHFIIKVVDFLPF